MLAVSVTWRRGVDGWNTFLDGYIYNSSMECVVLVFWNVNTQADRRHYTPDMIVMIKTQ